MGTEGLKIVIGADISEATSGLKAASESVSKFSKSSVKSFEQVNAGLKKIPEATKNIFPEASIAEARATVKRLKDEISGLTSTQLQSESGKFLVSELGAAKAELKSVEAQSNLTNQAVGGNLTKGFGLLRQAALLIPGIGISGIIGAIGSVAIEVGADFLKMADAAKEAGKDMAKSFADAEGKVAGERATLQDLVGIARNETLSKEARVEAINKLNQEYDKYLPKLTIENISTAAVTEEVNKLSAALLRQAKIKGLQDLISKETAKQADLLTNSFEDNANTLDRVVAVLKGFGAGAAGINFETQIAGAERTGKSYKESADKIKIFNDALNELLTTDAKEGTLFTEKTKRQKKEEDFLKKQLDLLEKIRDAAKDFQGKLFDLKDIESATDKLAALEQQVGDLKLKIAVRDAKKAGLPAAQIAKLEDAIKQDTEKRLNEAFQKEALLLEFNPKLKFSEVKRFDTTEIAGHSFTFKEKINVALDGSNLEVQKIPVDITDLQDKISKATGLDKKIPIITIQEARIKVLGFKLGNFINEVEKINKEFSNQVKSIFENGLADTFSAIGEGFGEAVSTGDFGGGLKKAAQNILGIVGGVMQQLGRAMILAAIKIKLLKKAFEDWAVKNPALAIIAGIGLVAAGAALKNIKFDGPKFADGGIVSSPVIGQIGERFRPEVIMPLDRLPQLFKQFGGDFGGGMQLVPIINNEGLFLAVKRGERSAGRKF